MLDAPMCLDNTLTELKARGSVIQGLSTDDLSVAENAIVQFHLKERFVHCGKTCEEE